MVEQRKEVDRRSGRQIINRYDVVALLEQSLAEM
jgi:hypothetical protein